MKLHFAKTALFATLAIAAALTFSCGKKKTAEPSVAPAPVQVEAEAVKEETAAPSGEYKSVKIGEQVWMAENLNHETYSSKCFNNDTANCAKYGRLYNWETAKKVCPSGWHLPSRDEWEDLESFIRRDKSCSKCDAKHLKAMDGWNGLDSYGFAALPGGDLDLYGSFNYAGSHGYWWSV